MLTRHPDLAPIINPAFSSARFAMLASDHLVYVIASDILVKQRAKTDALPDSMTPDVLYEHYRAAIHLRRDAI
jgi:hypothetical protein